MVRDYSNVRIYPIVGKITYHGIKVFTSNIKVYNKLIICIVRLVSEEASSNMARVRASNSVIVKRLPRQIGTILSG